MSKDTVLIHKGGCKKTITKSEFIKHLIDFAANELEMMVTNTIDDVDVASVDELVRFHPIHFINSKMRHEPDDLCVKNLMKQLHINILCFASEYKDDFKRVWSSKGLV
jgi:hypothetical protein